MSNTENNNKTLFDSIRATITRKNPQRHGFVPELNRELALLIQHEGEERRGTYKEIDAYLESLRSKLIENESSEGAYYVRIVPTQYCYGIDLVTLKEPWSFVKFAHWNCFSGPLIVRVNNIQKIFDSVNFRADQLGLLVHIQIDVVHQEPFEKDLSALRGVCTTLFRLIENDGFDSSRNQVTNLYIYAQEIEAKKKSQREDIANALKELIANANHCRALLDQ